MPNCMGAGPPAGDRTRPARRRSSGSGGLLLRAHMPTTPRGPGPVAAVHRIFIVTALLCALAYAAWEFREMTRTGETLAGVRGALALLVAVGTGLYLRSLRGLGAKLTPRE